MSSELKPLGAPLTPDEEIRLAACESLIRTGLDNFVLVGAALTEVNDSRLYRKTHPDFKSWVKEKWDMTARHAYRLIEATAIVEAVRPIGHTLQTESQARELSKASPAKRAEVLEAVAAKGPVTARAIRSEIQDAVEVEKPRVTVDDQWKNAAGQPESWGPGGAPIKPADHAPEDDESDALFGLKRYWKKATKKERKEFLTWIKR